MKIIYSSKNINSHGGINFTDSIITNALNYKAGIEHDFNINPGMNKLMAKLLVQTGQLSTKNEGYIFDYDNQFIPTDKHDSKRSYKHADGYFPGIASNGNFPVYSENLNGNSNYFSIYFD